MKFNDLSGQVFRYLTVISRASNNKAGHVRWLCQCECGNQSIVAASALRSGVVKSCGCRKTETLTTHGMHKSPEYRTWQHMWQRCTNPNVPSYKLYKDRKPPNAWLDFNQFLKDMGKRPDIAHSIDRINNDLPYGPDNCRWARMDIQNRNKKANRWIDFNGKRMILTDWARYLGITVAGLSSRLKRWPLDKALTTPFRKK